MLLLILAVVIISIPNCQTRSAVKYFIEHRKIHNCTFTILSNVNASNTTWIEYKYFIHTDKSEPDITGKGSTLKVGIFENPNLPFDCKGITTGYSLKILKLLQDCTSTRIEYKLLNRNESLTKQLLTKEIDLLACHPDNHDLHTRVVCLFPTIKSNYVLIYKPNQLRFTTDIFITTFAGTLWLCFLIMLIVLAVCLYITTKQYKFIYVNNKSWSWLDITLWANAAACQQGLSHVPSGLSSRFIFFLGYIISYLLYTGFAAGITSLLLHQDVNQIKTISDIQKLKLKLVTLTESQNLMNRNNLESDLLTVSSVDDLLRYIEGDNSIIGILPKIVVEHYINHKSEYTDSLFSNTQYRRSFLILKNHNYRKYLNKKLLSLQENGLLTRMLQKSLPMAFVKDNTRTYSSARIEHVGSAILLLVVGILGSMGFLVVELIVAIYTHRI